MQQNGQSASGPRLLYDCCPRVTRVLIINQTSIYQEYIPTARSRTGRLPDCSHAQTPRIPYQAVDWWSSGTPGERRSTIITSVLVSGLEQPQVDCLAVIYSSLFTITLAQSIVFTTSVNAQTRPNRGRQCAW